ncbi:MAG TPA: signal peptide peptidase SppA [Rhodothermales bacterium]|nr:signal peptide peptidase SppA [Rhodothermales bacterium]
MRFLSNLLASTLGTLIALFVVFVFFVVFIFAVAAASDSTPHVADSSVLVVTLDGAIPEISAPDPISQAFSDEPSYDLRDLNLALEKASVDERISAVWLQIQGLDAPWATLQEVRTALERFKKSGKPVYASSDDYAMDEATYFVASVADSVFSSPESGFEFNGFYLAAEFYSDLLEKLDVEAEVVRAGKYKSAVEPFLRDDLSPENQEQLTALLSSWNDVFLKSISAGRGIPVDSLQRILQQSALVTARDADSAGLLDALLYRDQVTDILKRRLHVEQDDDLHTISIASYARVPESSAGIKRGDDGDIAIVYAVGAILSGESGYNANPLLGGTTVGAETFNHAMREARENDRVKAIVLRVNSPGGSASAADAMWREISLAAEQKPLIVSMGDYAASGGYWISTPADTIVAEPLTITGSIGVFSIMFDASGLFANKLGITHDFVRTSPFADMYSGLRPLSDRERAILDTATQETYEAFLQNVANGRGMTTAQVDSIAQGRVWSGAQAQQLGLVDVLGNLDTAISLAAERAGLLPGSYRTRILPHPKSFIERIVESMNARASAVWTRLSTSPFERALAERVRLAHELVRMHGTVQAMLPADIAIH